MTSRDVYHRIRWDPRIDASRVTVGIEDRFRGVLDLPFGDGKLERDVPWHRIQHFRYDGRTVWDREGLDLLDSILEEPAEQTCLAWRWSTEAARWEEARPAQGELPWQAPLRLLTFNVLFDLYDKSVPSTASRLPGLLALLREADADLICLQEVTPRLLGLLLDDGWVRQGYWLSHGPTGPDLNPYGQILLSRLPCQVETRALTAGKSVLHARFAFGSGLLEVLNVHLFSDRAGDSAELRRRQLDEVRAYLQEDSSAWIVGDLNETGLLEVEGFLDAWTRLRPADFGLTYDPCRNELAGRTSVSGTEARFDRVLLRGGWTPSRIDVLQSAASISDHEPVLCELMPPLESGTVHHSALVVIPPESVWPPLQAIRERHDKSFARWMPHFNLLYGFLPEESFEEALERLRPLLSCFPSFGIRLRQVERFRHRGSTTVWLKPECDPPGALERLQAMLQACFPGCTEQCRQGAYTPHLTVASLKDGVREPRWPSLDLAFEVDSVALISRRDEQPFEVRHRIALAPALSMEQAVRNVVGEPGKALSWPALQALAERAGGRLFPVGSSGLGLGLPWSDLDAAVVSPHSAERLYEALGFGRLVSGRVHVLRGEFQGHKVDLQLACLPQSWSLRAPEELSDEEVATLPEQTQRALQARRELVTLEGLVKADRLRPFLRAVRLWTHQRALDTPALGFPGGWAWTLLAAGALLRAEGRGDGAPWLSLLQEIEGRSWPRPFVLARTWGDYKARPTDRFPIISLTAPYANVAPHVVPSTLQLLRHEARRGHALVRQGRWDELFQAPARQAGALLGYTSGQAGVVESRLLTLLLALEKAGCRARPHRPARVAGRCELWCDLTGPSASTVLASFADQLAQQDQVDLSWQT